MKRKKRIYLDNAATTPIDSRVLSVMEKTAREIYGNPSSLHKEGILARNVLTDSRKNIADILHANPDEVVFTSGGTEANNLALFGSVSKPVGSHIVVSTIEHPSVLECVKELEYRGAEVSYIAPDEKGITSPRAVKDALQKNTVLVSVMYANNEIGTIQPLSEIAKTIRVFRGDKIFPVFHTDACQATNYLEMNVLRLGVDLMTFNSSKIYGPKGIGALYVKRGTKLSEQVFGGGQERGIRSGTENVAMVKGFSEAMRSTLKMKEKETIRLAKLRDYFISSVLKTIPGSILNGDSVKRLPNNANISFPEKDGEEMVIALDARGIAVSTGSACANIARDGKVSHVMNALGALKPRAVGAVRFTLGRETKKEDLDYVLNALRDIMKR